MGKGKVKRWKKIELRKKIIKCVSSNFNNTFIMDHIVLTSFYKYISQKIAAKVYGNFYSFLLLKEKNLCEMPNLPMKCLGELLLPLLRKGFI